MSEKKKRSASEIRKEIGINFPEGFAETNYNYERFQANRIGKLDCFVDFLVSKLNKTREELENEFEHSLKN